MVGKAINPPAPANVNPIRPPAPGRSAKRAAASQSQTTRHACRVYARPLTLKWTNSGLAATKAAASQPAERPNHRRPARNTNAGSRIPAAKAGSRMAHSPLPSKRTTG